MRFKRAGNTLPAADGTSGQTVQTIAVHVTPTGVAHNEQTSTIFVTDFDANTVSVIHT